MIWRKLEETLEAKQIFTSLHKLGDSAKSQGKDASSTHQPHQVQHGFAGIPGVFFNYEISPLVSDGAAASSKRTGRSEDCGSPPSLPSLLLLLVNSASCIASTRCPSAASSPHFAQTLTCHLHILSSSCAARNLYISSPILFFRQLLHPPTLCFTLFPVVLP